MSRVRLVLAVLLVFTCFTHPAAAASPRKMVVITINNTTFEDLLDNIIIWDIARKSCIGLMNTRSCGMNNQYKAYLTLGSGEKADIHSDCLESYVVDKNIKKYYEDIVLNQCIPGNIVNPSINLINSTNLKTLYKAEPGKLGNLLRQKGFKTAFIGGFWLENSIKSPAFFINMDKFGLVDYGEINNVFKDKQNDTSLLLDAYVTYKDISDFIVIELGDIESLYANKKLYNENSYEVNKLKIIERYGDFLKSVLDSTDFKNTVLLIMSPYAFDTVKGNRESLSPVIIFDGGKSSGILTSMTTKTPGIVSALDFAPFVSSYFGTGYDGFSGYPFQFVSLDKNIEYIQKLSITTMNTASSRVPILRGYALSIIAISFLYTAGTFRRYKSRSDILSYFIETLLIIPIFILLEGSLCLSSLFHKIIFIIMASIILKIFLRSLVPKPLNRAAVISALNLSLLSVDLITGENMLRNSVLSYSPIIGARYYGLGNEYLGVMVGCALIFCICISEMKKKSKVISIPVLILLSILIGFPWFGTNIGGFITAVFSFLLFMLLETGYSVKSALKVSVIVTVLFLSLIIIISLVFNNFGTHLTLLVKQTNYYGIIYLWDTVLRKASTSLRLIKHSIWSLVLLSLVVCSVIIFIKTKFFKGSDFFKVNKLKKTWIAIPIACFIALASNDSGIITASFIMMYGFFSFILIS